MKELQWLLQNGWLAWHCESKTRYDAVESDFGYYKHGAVQDYGLSVSLVRGTHSLQLNLVGLNKVEWLHAMTLCKKSFAGELV